MPVEIIKKYQDGTYKCKDKRTGTELYGYDIRVENRRKRRSGFPTREKAQEARAAVRLKPLLAEHGLIRVERVRLADLVSAWLEDAKERGTSPIYRNRAVFVFKLFADGLPANVYLDEIKPADVRRYKSMRLTSKSRTGEPLHPHTMRQDIAIMKSVFNSASRLFPGAKWHPPVITKPARLYESREVVLTPEQINSLLDAVDREPDNRKLKHGNALVRDYIIIALHTARRESEILTLKKAQVDFTPGKGAPFGRIAFQLAKKNSGRPSAARRRVIPMTGPVAAIARRRIESSNNDYLFQRGSQDAIVGMLIRGFRRICKRAGIAYGYENNGAVIHTLRHSAATYLSSLGLPLADIKEILGHDSLAMSLKYSHSTPEGLDRAITALSSFGVRLESAEVPETPDKPDIASASRSAKAQ